MRLACRSQKRLPLSRAQCSAGIAHESSPCGDYWNLLSQRHPRGASCGFFGRGRLDGRQTRILFLDLLVENPFEFRTDGSGGSSGQQAELIAQLARGLAAFDADLINHRGRVTTLVMTEFGRRLYENGSLGTDHGRGFAMFAMGHGIKGGRVHGKWPGLAEEETPGSTTLSIGGPSGLKVLFDYRSVLSEVLTRILGQRDLSRVFPNFHPEPVGLAG